MNTAFVTIFRWHALRYVARHKYLALLNILSIALGTAVYLSIEIANHSASESLTTAIDIVAGKAQLEVRGAIDEREWPRIRSFSGVKEATALVEGIATLPDLPGEYLRFVGVDLFSVAPFANFKVGAAHQSLDLDEWLGRRGSIAVTDIFAREHHLHVGSHVRILIETRIETVKVVSLIETTKSLVGAQPRLAAVDLGWAQELFGKQGRLDAIQLLLEQPNDAWRVQSALQATLRPDCRVQPPRQRSLQLQTMLSAFRLNLTALSLISLLVGAFLIYNTTSASVTRRQVELGTLRACGATRGQIRTLFILEAGTVGGIGVALGIIGGISLGGVTSNLVGRTVSSLYTLLTIDRLAIAPQDCLVAAALGMLVVLVAAWMPADEAARVDPALCLSSGSHGRLIPVQTGISYLAPASGVFAIVSGWRAVVSGPAWLAFASAFFTMLTFAVLCPAMTRLASGLLGRMKESRGETEFLGQLRAIWRIAADRLGRSVRRNSITAAALAMAVAMTIGLTVMIHSFRETVLQWVGQTVAADLYIAPASNETIGLGAVIPSDAVEWVRRRVGVAGVETFREVRVNMLLRDTVQSVLLAVVDGSRRNIELVGKDHEVSAVPGATNVAVVSESFSRRYGVRAGDKLGLLSPQGKVELHVTAVYRDYTRDEGVILLSLATFTRFWKDEGPQSMAVYVTHKRELNELESLFRQRFGPAGEYHVYSNRGLRQRILEIFDATFAVTRGLRLVALVVAILGIGLSVSTLVAERQRETGMLRAIGCSRMHIRSLFAVEAAMIGSIAAGIGLVCGLALAVVLTWVVNPAFFGWTIGFSVPLSPILSFCVLVIVVSFIAAWIPAGEAATGSLAETLREE